MTLERSGCLLLRGTLAVVRQNQTSASDGVGAPGTGRVVFGGTAA